MEAAAFITTRTRHPPEDIQNDWCSTKRNRDGAKHGCSNADLIKWYQIGTVSPPLDAVTSADRDLGMACTVSHRSGETIETFIGGLAVGTGVG